MGQPPPELVLCEDQKLDLADVEALVNAAGIAVAARRGKSPAIALASFSECRPEVDFLHPKLCAPSRRMAARTLWAGAAAAVIALVAIFVWADLFGIQRDIARSEKRLGEMDQALKVAKPFVENMALAENFQSAHPEFLRCIKDIHEMIPQNGPTYLTALHMQGMKGDLSGHSSTDKEVIDMLDKFAASGRFADVKRKLEGRGTNGEVTFSVTFTYVPRAY
jgi:hypothetical protein